MSAGILVFLFFLLQLWPLPYRKNSPVLKALLECADRPSDIAIIYCCKPKACHGDVVKAANRMDTEKQAADKRDASIILTLMTGVTIIQTNDG